MHLFAAVATVILVQPAQPKDAQDWFKTMEKKLTAAKTVRIVAAIKVEGAAKLDGRMSLIMAEGNKLTMTAASKGADQNDMDNVTSDGTKTVSDTTNKKQGKTTRNTENDLNSKCLALLLRVGVFTAVDELTMPNSQPKVEDLTLENWKKGETERVGRQTAQIIEYDCKVKGLPVPLKCKLWIDTETFLPVKRTLLVAGGGLEYRYMETFNEVVLDEKVDPKTFELPQ